ncbi:hypothetical protein KGF57_001345 [Candida theae]|uniref:Uncharacterized protein n=1 Tax=Candida theae TaxID=1198502 RepID=A0AAD5FZZ9_9ASCO|nr:uncharacterized protein KGF57_001345 [Candida theae]KAI5962905.1 hypothetical protein KGF57_001345 [Candida theae]
MTTPPKSPSDQSRLLSPQPTLRAGNGAGYRATLLNEDDFLHKEEEDDEGEKEDSMDSEEEEEQEREHAQGHGSDKVNIHSYNAVDDNGEAAHPAVNGAPDDEHQVSDFNPMSRGATALSRRLTKSDAESIVGGDSIRNVHDEYEADVYMDHPTADPDKPTEDQEVKIGDHTFTDTKMKQYNPNQKVFSFALPFGGGFSSLRENVARHLHQLKNIDVPFVKHDEEHKIDEELHRKVELRLQRQQSISTVDEEQYFKGFKGVDDGRSEAIRHALTPNFNELLPIKNKKDLPDYESIYDRIDGNIVIMGGYRGSILRDTKTHKRVWIPLKAGFNLRKIDLLLGPNKEDEWNAEEKMYPDGILSHVGPIDVCRKLIKKLDANPNVNIHEFGYDWRLSGDYVSHKLEEFLTKIHQETGKPTLVIAHSMGGLMVHGAVQRNPKLFRSVVYVGSPSECLNILGPIRFGDSVLLSDKILTFETNFMMRSSFIFLPLSGETFYDKKTKEKYKIDFFDPDNWVEYNLNPLVSKQRKIEAESKGKKLNEQHRSRTFSIASSIGLTRSPSPPSSIISSSTFPSINQISSKFSKMYRSTSLKKFKRGSDSATDESSPPPSSASASASATTTATTTTVTATATAAATTPSSTLNGDAASPARSSSSSPSPSPPPSSSNDAPCASEPQPPAATSMVPGVDSTGTQSTPHPHQYSFTFAESYRYLSETLESTKKYVLSLEHDPKLAAEYPPMAMVYGNRIPSVRGSLVRSRQDIKDGNYYEFFYGHGDGVIHQKWLMPEKKGFTFYDKHTGTGEIVGKFASEAAHVGLMTDLDTMGKALNAVFEAEKFWEQKKLSQRRKMRENSA